MNNNKLSSVIRSGMSVLLSISIALLSSAMALAVTEDKIGKYDYTITNPYKDVDWDTWHSYRGATHVHTVRSDGNVELNDMIEKYYALGYQALALTDHGTVNYSWTKDQKRLAIFGYQYFVHGNVDEISEARYQQITTGSDRNGNGMTEIPLGIELNGSSKAKCHVNSYFADCGHGDLETSSTWPESAVKKCQNAGGICHINHVGEWTEGKSNIGTYDEAFVSKFSGLFLNFSSCIGMELVNTADNRTHNDRYLYDQTLMKTAKVGRNIYGFCEDDAHDYSDCGKNAQFFMMPSNTQANIRTSMETGAFFACSQNAKNADELGDGFTAVGDFPMVSRIDVNEEKDQISFTAYNGTVIKMVADGVVIDSKDLKGNNDTVTFDLNNYESQIHSYVRFYITGEGGICYAQPFLLSQRNYPTSTVSFKLSQQDANVTVKDLSGKVIDPVNSDNYYTLAEGTYSYNVSCEGYEPQIKTFTITKADITCANQIVNNITLDKIIIRPSTDKPTKVDHEHHLIYGVQPGISSLDAYVSVDPGATMTCIPTKLGFGTGTVANIENGTGNSKTYSLVIFGDVDGDGMYDGEDAFLVTLLASGLLKQDQVSEAVWAAADCNHDGSIDDLDVDILNQAGLLLSQVTQNEPDITTSSVYSSYINLISQDIESNNVEDNDVEDNNVEEQKPEAQISIFDKIFDVINCIVSRIISMFNF